MPRNIINKQKATMKPVCDPLRRSQCSFLIQLHQNVINGREEGVPVSEAVLLRDPALVEGLVRLAVFTC